MLSMKEQVQIVFAAAVIVLALWLASQLAQAAYGGAVNLLGKVLG